MRYTITKPLSELPPNIAKTIKITSNRTIDFIREFNAVCVALTIHNHSGGTATYKINEENDELTLPTGNIPESIENVYIEKIVVNSTDTEIICQLAFIPRLQKLGAIESG